MSLDLEQLEMVRKLPGNQVQARCPACAEDGGDRAGQHLRVYPDGRYGCCVHPRDGEHRRRIFALAGDRSKRGFTIRVAHMQPREGLIRSVKACLRQHGGTLGTAKSKSEASGKKVSQVCEADQKPLTPSFGTLGTGISHPRAYAREGTHVIHTCKDIETGVPSVPDWKRRHPQALIDEIGRPLPYVRGDGTLVIPFDADPRFHYWRGGQSLAQTKEEAISRKEMKDGIGV